MPLLPSSSSVRMNACIMKFIIFSRYDSLTIYEGNSTSDEKAGPFCGTTAPEVVSSRGQMMVQFNTDASVTGRGFLARYSVAGKRTSGKIDPTCNSKYNSDGEMIKIAIQFTSICTSLI